MKDSKDLLLSAMIPTDMLDNDDDTTQSEVVGDVIVQYDFLQIIENIGMIEFREIYNNFIIDIKKQSFLNQQILCNHMIEQIQNVYNFKFPEKLILSDHNDIEGFYIFVEFLEYDNEEFLIEILKGFDVDFNKVESDEFCQKNSGEIIKQINFYGTERLNPIFANLYETLENKIFIPIISRMILKNKEVINNELKIRKLQIERI